MLENEILVVFPPIQTHEIFSILIILHHKNKIPNNYYTPGVSSISTLVDDRLADDVQMPSNKLTKNDELKVKRVRARVALACGTRCCGGSSIFSEKKTLTLAHTHTRQRQEGTTKRRRTLPRQKFSVNVPKKLIVC